MKREFVLTSSQSKRLIARGVKAHPVVKRAIHNGVIGICRGTTCSYVAEEFLGRPLERFSYTTGLTLPKEPLTPVKKPDVTEHDVIIRKGEIHQDGETVIEAAQNMNPGDVIVKGANALNYNEQVVGCLVEHPKGGTVGGFWGPLYGRKLQLVIPVGLEKEIAQDIMMVSSLSMTENPGNALMPMTGIIVTEIEAVELLTGASAVQMAAGGIRGAEGAVRLLVSGEPEQVRQVETLAAELEGEEPY